jgi:hypothetical protein
MSAPASATSDGGGYSPGERVRWSSALWTVTERDGPLARIEWVGTVPTFGLTALWVGTSLLEPIEREGF